MNIARLKHLIRVLLNAPIERFDMIEWKCGTTACAAGWAAQDPDFNIEGFILADKTRTEPARPAYITEYETLYEWEAIMAFFGLDVIQAGYLFLDLQYVDEHGKEFFARPKDVVERIEKMIAEEMVAA
jgi:hypothetical protein